jgi:hypothetical protein
MFKHQVPQSIGPAALLLAVVAAAGFAWFHSANPSAPAEESRLPEPTEAPVRSPSAELPPNHPPIGGQGSPLGSRPATSDEAPSVRWKAPSAWESTANPNAMRIATYRVPPAPGESEGGEAIVARAGGTPEANIARWIGQFDDRTPDKRTETVVGGFKVHLVEVSGTYSSGGMMPGTAALSHTGWSLVGAVVDAPGSPYFFKLTGPTATVSRARKAFDAWIASITPS